MDNGIYENMSTKEYRKIDAFHYSAVKHILRSPAHYMYEIMNPSGPTKIQVMGNLIDCLVLTPGNFAKEYKVLPTTYVDSKNKEKPFTMQSKTCKATHKAIVDAGLIPVTQDEINIANNIKDSTTKQFGELIDSCKKQVVLIGEIEEVKVKCRLDMFNEEERFIVDLKSTKNAHIDSFNRILTSFGYHVQAALYSDVLFSLIGELAPFHYRYLVAETEPPYCPAYYFQDAEGMLSGKNTYLKALRIYKTCKESGHWPGYNTTPEPEPIDIKAWAIVQNLNEEDFNG